MSQTPLIDLSPKLFVVIQRCQDILADYVLPDSGITENECINKLMEVLDNRELIVEMRKVSNSGNPPNL